MSAKLPTRNCSDNQRSRNPHEEVKQQMNDSKSKFVSVTKKIFLDFEAEDVEIFIEL
jgi:hypothetical protein